MLSVIIAFASKPDGRGRTHLYRLLHDTPYKAKPAILNSIYEPPVSTTAAGRPSVLLETERLIMRPPELGDFDDSYAMWSEEVVTRHITGRPSTLAEAWARLMRSAGHWTLLGFGFWVVRDKESGKFVGEVGFGQFKREMEPSLGTTPEIGWVLAPAAHGQGYATEAVRAALAWASLRWPDAETACIISPENSASLRVAKKCGYLESEQTSYLDHATIILRRTA